MKVRLKIYSQEQISNFVKTKNKETKFGEKVGVLAHSDLDTGLQNSTAKYVLVGIPNQNDGKKDTVWQILLEQLLNTQNNSFNKGKKLLVLGHLDFSDVFSAIDALDMTTKEDHETLHLLLQEIDRELTNIAYTIIKNGKKPIIIGYRDFYGYALTKGCSLALNKAVNVINFDTYSDFGKNDKRNYENAFSYGFYEGFINKYYMFGLREKSIPKKTFKEIMEHHDKLSFNTFESIEIEKESSFSDELIKVWGFIKNRKFGLHIDCKNIQHTFNEGIFSSGFSVNQTRQLTAHFSRSKKATYLCISEVDFRSNQGHFKNQLGNILAHLISDFI